MVWDNTIKLADLAVVTATLLGPVLAVQAQKWLEKKREKRERQRWIFSRLMGTRAALLSPAHVEAINAIPLEFYGQKHIIDAWKAYLDHLNVPGEIPSDALPVWTARRIELLAELMHRIAESLGYDFNTVEITKEFYSPKAHGQVESDQEIIRRGIARLFSGDALPIAVTAMPTDPNAREQFLKLLKGETALQVKVTS